MEFTVDYEEFADRVVDIVDDLNDMSLIPMDEPSDRELLLLFLGLKVMEEIKMEQAKEAADNVDTDYDNLIKEMFEDIFGDIGE